MSKEIKLGFELERFTNNMLNRGVQCYVRNQINKNGKRITYFHDPTDKTNIKYSIMEQYEGYSQKK
tara:strand:- start:334 stop:531 length:198 start_codon:yes stop_codon:yes gene_type:complete